ncbi:MAG: hypothetical protein JST91_24430 [Actinobacteria bacterium]|nr:hypothetical protein [Actinomycetota bacterium]
MRGAHSDLGPELRQLAQAILDRLEPAVRAAAAAAAAQDPGKCQQMWCPVCALAALVRGEQHPLLTVIGEHSAALLAVIRAVVDDAQPPPPPPESPPSGPGRYQHIPVTVEE